MRAESIIREDHGNHGVSMIANQDQDKVVIDSRCANVCRTHGGGVSNVDIILFTCENKSITDRVAIGKVENTHTSVISVGT